MLLHYGRRRCRFASPRSPSRSRCSLPSGSRRLRPARDGSIVCDSATAVEARCDARRPAPSIVVRPRRPAPGTPVVLSATSPGRGVTFAWDLDADGAFERGGATVSTVFAAGRARRSRCGRPTPTGGSASRPARSPRTRRTRGPAGRLRLRHAVAARRHDDGAAGRRRGPGRARRADRVRRPRRRRLRRRARVRARRDRRTPSTAIPTRSSAATRPPRASPTTRVRRPS